MYCGPKTLTKGRYFSDPCFLGTFAVSQKAVWEIVCACWPLPKRQMGLYKKATVLQAPTQAIAQSIRNQSATLDKISVQPYPLSLPVPSEIPFKNKEKTVLYVGRIHPRKELVS